MKTCVHCGNKVADDTEICLNCGCTVEKKFTVSFQREEQWFFVAPSMNIQISGQSINYSLVIESGESISMQLSQGIYKIHIYTSNQYYDCTLNLQKNTEYKLALNSFNGKIEVWEL